MPEPLAVSVVVPTFQREQVLLDTIGYIRSQLTGRGEIVVVDQTPKHQPEVETALAEAHKSGSIRWIRLPKPSIPAAMNAGLLAARGAAVIYVDDDVIPASGFIDAHLDAQRNFPKHLIAGRVLQPWHVSGNAPLTGLASTVNGPVEEFIGCNFSVPRELALQLGGFDERFAKVAYRFEAEFGLRACRSGFPTYFCSEATVEHLRSGGGGTRSYGDHLRTFLPAHSVGEYYFLFKSRPAGWFRLAARRLLLSSLTRHHLRRPWWIPATLISELSGLFWALVLCVRGRKLVDIVP